MEVARQLAPTHFMGTAMTWSQYATPDEILRAAIRCMEQGADMFYTLRSFEFVEMLSREGVPVQRHMGLIPTFSLWSREVRAFGRTAEESMQIYRIFKRYEESGCFAVEIECVAEETLRNLNEKTSIVTFSLGSGNAGDAIILFVSDICGESESPPRHAYAFGNLAPLHQEIY